MKQTVNKTIENITSLNSKKGEKGLKSEQQDILTSIEKQNIEKHVQDLMNDFKSPKCSKCLNRKADRVCINKSCGPSQYMQIICGKCHVDSHSVATIKPEIDIEEFFSKLAQFLHVSQRSSDEESQKGRKFKFDNLKISLDDIEQVKNKLTVLKQQLTTSIEGCQPFTQIHSQVHSSVTQALSLCEFNNINEQMRSIKKIVTFSENKFKWNDQKQQFQQFMNGISSLVCLQRQLAQSISKSFTGATPIDLSSLEIQCGLSSDKNYLGKVNISYQNESIVIPPIITTRQMYLNYELNPNLKYRMRFTVLESSNKIFVLGLFPKSQVSKDWVSVNPSEDQFLKWFFLSNKNINTIVRGNNLQSLPTPQTQIEMRFDISNNYIDFSDYPEYKNINSNAPGIKLKNEPYVVVLALDMNRSIQIDSFEEVNNFEEL